MKKIYLCFITLTLAAHAQAQKPTPYAVVDKKALEIPAAQTETTKEIAAYINNNFTTQADKVRAAFIWTASNIDYDVENMYALNFHERTKDKIDKALKTHKGICEAYASVFCDICRQCGLNAYIVAGYNKHGGQTSYIPHAWSAVMVDGQWCLFDPTWGSGYIANEKFVHHVNNEFFNAAPSASIKTHMPFDPMWQLMNYPLTNQEFYEGKTEGSKAKPFFSHPDSIAAFEKLDTMGRMEAEARRVEQNGIKNGMIFDWLANLKRNIEITRQQQLVNEQNEKVNAYNSVVEEFNGTINDLNAFINYRNAQFTPKKTDQEIQGMMDTVSYKLKRAHDKLNAIKNPEPNIAKMIISLQKSIADATGTADEQQDFLKKYFAKPKMMRKTMFYKYTWMGVPLN